MRGAAPSGMRVSANAQAVAMNPAGQVIGQINEIESCRDVVFRLLSEYADALEHVGGTLGQ